MESGVAPLQIAIAKLNEDVSHLLEVVSRLADNQGPLVPGPNTPDKRAGRLGHIENLSAEVANSSHRIGECIGVLEKYVAQLDSTLFGDKR
jgi:hypothetical protein